MTPSLHRRAPQRTAPRNVAHRSVVHAARTAASIRDPPSLFCIFLLKMRRAAALAQWVGIVPVLMALLRLPSAQTLNSTEGSNKTVTYYIYYLFYMSPVSDVTCLICNLYFFTIKRQSFSFILFIMAAGNRFLPASQRGE
jgi:hypothetical protein